MKKYIRSIISYTCISITIALLATSIYNLLYSQQVWYYSRWLLMMGTIAFLYGIEFVIFARLDWMNKHLYITVEFLFWYLGMAFYIFGSGWMNLNLRQILIYTGIMIFSYLMMNQYSKLQIRHNAELINQALKADQT